MEWISDAQIWLSLVTLTFMEIVLGIDNVVFISILAGKLPEEVQDRARKLGLSLALITRIMLLAGIAWIANLVHPLFSVIGHEVSGRDLVLLAGGLFLIYKSTHEIHHKLEGEDGEQGVKGRVTFSSVIIQIMLLDIVFSLDSVITAVGMADELAVMIAAVVLAMVFMLYFAAAISNFVNHHPTVKMLALSFLLLIGVMLVAEGFHQHIPKGYIYFAMAFSVGVEILNLKMKSKSKSSSKPVALRQEIR